MQADDRFSPSIRIQRAVSSLRFELERISSASEEILGKAQAAEAEVERLRGEARRSRDECKSLQSRNAGLLEEAGAMREEVAGLREATEIAASGRAELERALAQKYAREAHTSRTALGNNLCYDPHGSCRGKNACVSAFRMK
jgi:predicted  nucleic acid-binding Zn-ribbon protein